MKKYKKPALVSYKSQDITEIMGPAQANSIIPDDAGLNYMFLALPVMKRNMRKFRPVEKIRRFVKRAGR